MSNLSNNNGFVNKNEDKDSLVSDILDLFSYAVSKHATEDDDEKKWLLKHGSPKIQELLLEISGIGLHILDAIGQFEPVNSITISKRTGIPKGTVSKIIRILTSRDLVKKSPLPNNKKEFVFSITPLGKEIFELHKALHHQIDIGINQFLKKYDTKELQFLVRFLKDFGEVTWTDMDLINSSKL